MQEFTVKSISEYTPLFSAIIAENESNIIVLSGDLGSGKTTFTKAFIKRIGSTDIVSSPTFSIVNAYALEEETIYHFDLYRIKNIDELLDLGFEEYLDNGKYIIIEWPEVALPLLQDGYLSLEFHILNNTSRKITVTRI